MPRKTPIHLVLKANRSCLRGGFRTYKRYFLIQKLLDRYSRRFFVKIEQVSIQHDHIHLLIRSSRRSRMQNFFRVVSGQIAQQLERAALLNLGPRKSSRKYVTDTPRRKATPSSAGWRGLWRHRPFTRVVRGWKAYRTVRKYIELNEHEAMGRIFYQAKRLKGLSSAEWNLIWS